MEIQAKSGGEIVLGVNSGDQYTTIMSDGTVHMQGANGALYINIGYTPVSSVGNFGDLAGMVAFDSDAIYYCVADYSTPYSQSAKLTENANGNAVTISDTLTNSDSLQTITGGDLSGWGIFYQSKWQLIGLAQNNENGTWTLFLTDIRTLSNGNLTAPAGETIQISSPSSFGTPAADIWRRQQWTDSASW